MVKNRPFPKSFKHPTAARAAEIGLAGGGDAGAAGVDGQAGHHGAAFEAKIVDVADAGGIEKDGAVAAAGGADLGGVAVGFNAELLIPSKRFLSYLGRDRLITA